MAMPAIKVKVPFCPLLKKITDFLKFEEPKYQSLPARVHKAMVSVGPDTEGMLYAYDGSEALSIGEARDSAAQKAVQDLMARFGVTVKDVTYSKNLAAEERLALYGLKRLQLQAIEAGLTGAFDKQERLGQPTRAAISVIIDYTPVLFEALKMLGISCTTVEVVQKKTGRFVAWLTFAPSAKIAQTQTVFGDECLTTAEAWENLAEKAILYLMPLYNLQVVDANYDVLRSGYQELKCALAKESCMTIRERISGIHQNMRSAGMDDGELCITPRGSPAKIPTQKAPPLPPRKRYSRIRGEGLGAVQASGETGVEFFKVPADFEKLFQNNREQ